MKKLVPGVCTGYTVSRGFSLRTTTTAAALMCSKMLRCAESTITLVVFIMKLVSGVQVAKLTVVLFNLA